MNICVRVGKLYIGMYNVARKYFEILNKSTYLIVAGISEIYYSLGLDNSEGAKPVFGSGNKIQLWREAPDEKINARPLLSQRLL